MRTELNKYHIDKDGNVFRVNADGSYTNLGNAEDNNIFKDKTAVKPKPKKAAPKPKKKNQSKASKKDSIDKEDVGFCLGCMLIILIIGVLGWFIGNYIIESLN